MNINLKLKSNLLFFFYLENSSCFCIIFIEKNNFVLISQLYVHMCIYTHHTSKPWNTKNKINWHNLFFLLKHPTFSLKYKMENVIQIKQILKLWLCDIFGSTDFLRSFPLCKQPKWINFRNSHIWKIPKWK